MNPISPTSRYSSPPSPATSNTQRSGIFKLNGMNCLYLTDWQHPWSLIEVKGQQYFVRKTQAQIQNEPDSEIKFLKEVSFNKFKNPFELLFARAQDAEAKAKVDPKWQWLTAMVKALDGQTEFNLCFDCTDGKKISKISLEDEEEKLLRTFGDLDDVIKQMKALVPKRTIYRTSPDQILADLQRFAKVQ